MLAPAGASLLTDLSHERAVGAHTAQCEVDETASSVSSAASGAEDEDDASGPEACAGLDLEDACAPSSIAISDCTTEDEAPEECAPLTRNVDVPVSLVVPTGRFGLAARSIMEARLSGGTGRETVVLQPQKPSVYYFAAYRVPAAYKSWCVIDVLGGAEAVLICENTVLWVDGCGAMGQGGWSALVHLMWDFARSLQAKALMLTARDGSTMFWQRAGLRPVPAAYRAKRRSGTPRQRALGQLRQALEPTPSSLDCRQLSIILQQLEDVAICCNPPFFSWI